ncbi:phage virion morphogenesis protein [Ursidibacter arcticus]
MIEIEVSNSEQIQQVLTDIAEHIEQRSELMKRIAGTMEAAVLTNFDEGGRPAWLGIKYREGKPLVDTENLMGSIHSKYNNDLSVVGTNVAYAAIHHFGGKAGRGKNTEIPARPFLVLTADDEEDILQDAQNYFRSLVG